MLMSDVFANEPCQRQRNGEDVRRKMELLRSLLFTAAKRIRPLGSCPWRWACQARVFSSDLIIRFLLLGLFGFIRFRSINSTDSLATDSVAPSSLSFPRMVTDELSASADWTHNVTESNHLITMITFEGRFFSLVPWSPLFGISVLNIKKSPGPLITKKLLVKATLNELDKTETHPR